MRVKATVSPIGEGLALTLIAALTVLSGLLWLGVGIANREWYAADPLATDLLAGATGSLFTVLLLGLQSVVSRMANRSDSDSDKPTAAPAIEGPSEPTIIEPPA